jgi:hypothetical protein
MKRYYRLCISSLPELCTLVFLQGSILREMKQPIGVYTERRCKYMLRYRSYKNAGRLYFSYVYVGKAVLSHAPEGLSLPRKAGRSRYNGPAWDIPFDNCIVTQEKRILIIGLARSLLQ